MCADDNELKFVETSSVAFFRTTVAPDYSLTPQILCGCVYCLVDGYINGIYFSTPFHLVDIVKSRTTSWGLGEAIYNSFQHLLLVGIEFGSCVGSPLFTAFFGDWFFRPKYIQSLALKLTITSKELSVKGNWNLQQQTSFLILLNNVANSGYWCFPWSNMKLRLFHKYIIHERAIS